MSNPSRYTLPRAALRRLCWSLGAFCTDLPDDAGISHVIAPSSTPLGTVVTLSVSDTQTVLTVLPEWLIRCAGENALLDEEQFVTNRVVVQNPTPIPSATSKPRQPLAPALSYRPSDSSSQQAPRKPAHPSIMARRSDAASMPLRPDGVFKDMQFSLLGWSDSRLESALSYQVTSNGGYICDFPCRTQFACICADGTRPTRDGDTRLVSQRWVNECLAHGDLVDPASKVLFTPSMAQLPVLMMSNICLYITEKEPKKFDDISEIAKICGIRFVSRNESRTPLSQVTHFIFHDFVSVNRRRDLIPIAKRSGKFVVSLDWLKDCYLAGTRQDEARYDMSSDVTALPPVMSPSDQPGSPGSRPLEGKSVVICNSSFSGGELHALAESLGARIVPDEGHMCDDQVFVRISNAPSCTCNTVTEVWLQECGNQRRIVSTQSYIVRFQDASVDQLMIAEDKRDEIKWQNKRADNLKESIK